MDHSETSSDDEYATNHQDAASLFLRYRTREHRQPESVHGLASTISPPDETYIYTVICTQ